MLAKFSFFISAFFYVMSVCAQTSKEELIKEVYAEENDSLKMELYKRLGVEWEAYHLDSAIHYYNEGISIAKAKNYRKRLAVLEINKAFAYSSYGKRETSLEALQKGLEVYESIKDSSGVLLATYNLGTFSLSFGKLSDAVAYFKQSILLAEQLKANDYLNKSLNNISIAYQYMGDYQSSIVYLMKVLKIREAEFSDDLGLSYANLALAYSTQGDLEKAIEYYQLSIQSFKEKNKLSHTVNSLYNLTGVYLKQENFKKAKQTYNQAYLLSQKEEKPTMPGRFYLYESRVEVEKENYPKAIKNFERAITEFEKSGNKHLLVSSLTGITKAYLQEYKKGKRNADLRKAIEFGEKALSIAKESDLLEQVNSISHVLLMVYTEVGSLDKVRKYTNLYIQTRDSLYSKQKAKAVLELQTQYETEKKELEIDLLNKENRLKESQLNQSKAAEKQQKRYTLFTVLGLLFTLLIILVIYKLYQQKRKNLENLSEKNKIISLEKEKNELLLKEIHHRVKNNLQVISSLLDLQSENIEDSKALSAVEDGQSRVKAMALIHQKLYQNNDIGHIVFAEYAKELVQQLSTIYHEAAEVDLEIEANNISLDIDTAIPLGLILNELVSNAFKYAFKKQRSGELRISLEELTKGEFSLNVKDNGDGLPDDLEFRKTNSLGLRLVRRLSKQLYGSVIYKYNQGADFAIRFRNTESRKLVR